MASPPDTTDNNPTPADEPQLAFAWAAGDAPPHAALQSDQPVNTAILPPQPQASDELHAPHDGHYDAGHPWHYLAKGDNATPMPVDAIPAATNVAHTFGRELPKSRIKKLIKARELLEAERSQLEIDQKRYQELVDRGAEALSDYDRGIAYGGDLELARASALALKHNHIMWRKGRIAYLEQELSHSVARLR